MPFDRRITVQIRGPSYRDDQDRFVPGAPVDYHVWAEYRPQDLIRIAQVGGIATVTHANWRFRFFSEAIEASADLSSLKVIDEFGESFTVQNLYEDTGRDDDQRRRYIIAEGVHA